MGVTSTPPLTTVEFNPRAVADAAVDAIFDRLGLATSSPGAPTEVARLVVRSST
jgi:DNA-binding LacI/PurR family transcriptional regulator